MSDTLAVSIIIAATLVILLVLYRRRLSNLDFKMGRNGIEAQVKTHPPASSAEPNSPDAASSFSEGVALRNIRMIGEDQQISVKHDNAELSDIHQVGKRQSLNVKSEKPQKH